MSPAPTPTRPYLLRALHEWCCDNGLTPCIAVQADASVQVPREFVRDGRIVLNIGPEATHKLELGNECIRFQARFGGRVREIMVPESRVLAIYARETGQGMAFQETEGAGTKEAAPDVADTLPPLMPLAAEPPPDPSPPRPTGGGQRPTLRRIK